MRRADHLVVTPPVTVENVSLSPAAPGYRAQISREFPRGEEASAALQQLLERSADVRCDGQQ
ncbi:nitrate reductase domain protein [Mycobacterium kansasii]|uniref:Nitrate reductase domain protein n=1 Tax=Mycobacterium kansasii TaxID=1768 RepID=A0A1V3XP65_MYCKA|nr:nitrate reductase domain protein [Mycobacterium kansasii]